MTGFSVAALLRLLSVAEEELEGCTLPGLFMAVQPNAGFVAVSPDVYRAHVRELRKRAEEGGDLQKATRAEAMIAFHRMSLKFPLNRGAQVAYERLFSEVFPGHLPNHTPEEWEGQAEELIQDVQRKITNRLPGKSPA